MSSSYIINLINRWRWHLAIVALVAFFASVIFSGPSFITPKYKSFAIVYPSNLIAYSTENPTEQMLQLFHSSDIRDEVADQFHLADRYRIDTTGEHWRTELISDYNDNVSINKTEFESVEISVLDKDPVVASAMVDSILIYLDRKVHSLQSEKAQELLVIIENQLTLKKAEMDSMEVAVQAFRTQYGLLDYGEQTKEITRGYVKGLTDGRNGASMNEVKNMMGNLKDKGGEFFELNEHLGRVRSSYDDLKISYENALKDVNKKLSYSSVVTRPVPADKKSYPVRWLIVALSVIGSSLFAFIVILLLTPSAGFRTGKL